MLLFFAVACGGGAPGSSAPLASDEDAIIGGRIDAGHAAVGELGVAPRASGDDAAWICTATLITPRTVLTAAHCVIGEGGRPTAASHLRFRAGDTVVRGSRLHVSPTYAPGAASGSWDDLAVLELARAVSGIAPLAVASEAPEPGERLTVVGFGVTRATAPGTGTGAGRRRKTAISLAFVEPRELGYENEGHGSCYGDSGGPLIARRAGEEVVAGVTSRGSSVDCSGLELATRVDAFARWIGAAER